MGGGFPLLGLPYPRGRVLHQRPVRAHVAPASPRSSRFWSLSSRFLPLARWFALSVGFFFFFWRLHRSPPVSPLARRSVLCPPPPHVPSPPPRCPRPFPGRVGEKGVGGGGGRPRCPSSGVSTSQARRRHEARHLSPCRGGGGLAVWLPSSPFLPCVRTPGAPPAGAFTARASFGHGRVVRPAPSLRCLPTLPLCPRGGGGAVRPSLPSSPTLGGTEVCGGGGGGVSSSLRCTHVAGTTQARRRHEARHLSLCRGGGGACLVAPVVALSTLRSHPRWSPRWGLHGACPLRARSCGPSRTLSPLPPHPAAWSSGVGRFSPPPTCIPHPWGGGGVWGGEGRPCRLPFVARMSQARRKHDASTG